MRYSRRDALKIGATAAGALALTGLTGEPLAAARRLLQEGQLTKAIPSSGERIPAVGLGTASSFAGAARSPEEHGELREVLRLFTEMGGRVIDTAPTYANSEEVLGELTGEIGNRDEIFWATKISLRRETGREAGMAQMEQSLDRLGHVDLNQVHNLGDWRTQLPLLRELKAEGTIRYVGITTSRERQYEALAEILRTEELDFVQFDYAVDNRSAEEELIPIARDRGLATLINGPFGRTRLFRRVGDRPVPDWAADFGATSWAQFFLKWLLGHPAVTVVIPATSDPEHLVDNMGAGLGHLPNEEERARMAELVDGLPEASRR